MPIHAQVGTKLTMSFITVDLANALGFPNKKVFLKYLNTADSDVLHDVDQLRLKIDRRTRESWRDGWKAIVDKHDLDVATIIQDTINKITIENQLQKVAKESSLRTASSIIQSQSTDINAWQENNKRSRTSTPELPINCTIEMTPNLPRTSQPETTQRVELPSSAFTEVSTNLHGLAAVADLPSSPESNHTVVLAPRECTDCQEKKVTILTLSMKLHEATIKIKELQYTLNMTHSKYNVVLANNRVLRDQLDQIQQCSANRI